MCVSNTYHMHMNESTGRKNGPREEKQRREGCCHDRCGVEDCPSLAIAVLADALEEALAGWGEAMGDESAGTAGHFKRIEDLRSVLAEVDRG